MQQRTAANQYRITIRLTERLPEDLTGQRCVLAGSEVFVGATAKPPALSIHPISAGGPEEAMLVARRALNNLLNHFASVVQFRGYLENGYQYEPLDGSTGGTVLTPEPVVVYMARVDVPDGFLLETERRAAAFVRRGDASRDPFDRFRNYYLAADSVGKRLPGPQASDSRLLERTLPVVASASILVELVKQLTTADPSLAQAAGSPESLLNAGLYNSFRCALMHSGSASDFVPFDPEDELRVSSMLRCMRGVARQYVNYERVHSP